MAEIWGADDPKLQTGPSLDRECVAEPRDPNPARKTPGGQSRIADEYPQYRIQPAVTAVKA